MVIGNNAGSEIIGMLRRPEGSLYLQVSQALEMFTNYGVMFVLFHVGLHTHMAEVHRLGRQSLNVAVIGAFVPMLLGFLVMWLFDPATSQVGHIFIAATLGTTGVAVTAHDIYLRGIDLEGRERFADTA